LFAPFNGTEEVRATAGPLHVVAPVPRRGHLFR